MDEVREAVRGSENEGDAEKQVSPLSAIYPGEAVVVAGRQVWVKPWGVKAIMTEVPGLFGSLMAKLVPVYETAKGGGIGNEQVLRVLMENAGAEVVDFVAKSVGLSLAETEAMTAGEFVAVLRAVIRQNADFFSNVGGLYQDLGRPIESAVGGTGSQS